VEAAPAPAPVKRTKKKAASLEDIAPPEVTITTPATEAPKEPEKPVAAPAASDTDEKKKKGLFGKKKDRGAGCSEVAVHERLPSRLPGLFRRGVTELAHAIGEHGGHLVGRREAVLVAHVFLELRDDDEHVEVRRGCCGPARGLRGRRRAERASDQGRPRRRRGAGPRRRHALLGPRVAMVHHGDVRVPAF